MRKTKHGTNQRGMVSVEAAFMLCFFLIPVCFGIIDCSHYLRAASTVNKAVREGAVWLARGQDPLPVVQDYLESAGMDPARVTLHHTAQDQEAAIGEEVVLEVAYDLSGYTVIPWDTVFPESFETRMVVRNE